MSILGQVPGAAAYPDPPGRNDAAELDGDRGMPSVSGVKRSSRAHWIVAAFLLFVVAAVGGAAFLTLQSDGPEEPAPTKVAESSIPEKTFTAPVLPGAEQPTIVPAIDPTTPAEVQPPAGETPVVAAPALQPAPSLDKSASGLMIETDALQAATAAVTPGADAAAAGAPAGSGGALDGLLSSTSAPKARATLLGDRNYILAKGAFIRCALQTRMDSTVPGMVTCRVTRDVYSDNGRVVLIERGSLVVGEYQANMRQGMRRIYVLWTRVKTPYGVVVDLESPATDGLGGAGVPGQIKTHFWQRFGGAMLLSIIDDAAQYFADQSSNDDSQTIRTDSTSDAATEMAAVALENTINIPPTLFKHQGDEVGITIARDLDFSEVYRVRAH